MPEGAPYTDDDAKAFYEAARDRFAWQEARAERFASRGRHLGAVLTGLGGGAFYFGQRLLESQVAACGLVASREGGSCWAWSSQLLCVLLLGAVVVGGGTFVVLVLWSASYKGPSSPEDYWTIWDHTATYRLSRRAGLWMDLADVLLQAAKHNDEVDERRQRFLDRSKWAAAAGGCVLVLTVASSFWTMSSLTSSEIEEQHQDGRTNSEAQSDPHASAESRARAQ